MSATVHEHVRAKLAYPFEDRGERTLKNIATPVRIYSLGPGAIAKLPRSEPRSDTHKKSWRRFITAIAVAWLCAAALWALWRYVSPSIEMAPVHSSLGPTPAAESIVPTGAHPQSIVVLPFTNATGDPEQDYFADGITEDLTTDLSRIPGSFVIAPATAFAYKGKSIDVRQIGRDLSVRYALQGSVRRSGDSVRVNAQLVDAANASQLWAERFDGEVAQLARVHDDVTQRIAGALQIALVEVESQRAPGG